MLRLKKRCDEAFLPERMPFRKGPLINRAEKINYRQVQRELPGSPLGILT
jgi:hypothetical protein